MQSQPFIITVENLSSEEREVSLFDCKHLFKQEQDILISSAVPGVTYEDMLIKKFQDIGLISSIVLTCLKGDSFNWEYKDSVCKATNAPVIQVKHTEINGSTTCFPFFLRDAANVMPIITIQLTGFQYFELKSLTVLELKIPAKTVYQISLYPADKNQRQGNAEDFELTQEEFKALDESDLADFVPKVTPVNAKIVADAIKNAMK